MPNLISATVVRWRVINDEKKQTVVFSSQEQVQVMAGDGVPNTDLALVAEYILKQDKKDYESLLKDARNGLLQLTDVKKAPITAPPVPYSSVDPAKPAPPAEEKAGAVAARMAG